MKTTLTLIALCAIPAFAQTTLKEAMGKHWKTSETFTIAVANTMPADGYNFRPNPEEMTFGQLMAHIAQADTGACAAASGLKRPVVPANLTEWSKAPEKTDVSKDAAIGFLHVAFDFCNEAIGVMTPEKWDTIQGPPARKLTGLEWMWSYFTHTAHHRAQAEVYLRVKGIKPPDYAF